MKMLYGMSSLQNGISSTSKASTIEKTPPQAEVKAPANDAESYGCNMCIYLTYAYMHVYIYVDTILKSCDISRLENPSLLA